MRINKRAWGTAQVAYLNIFRPGFELQTADLLHPSKPLQTADLLPTKKPSTGHVKPKEAKPTGG